MAHRRRAILVASVLDLETRLTDAVLDMADKLIGGLFARARKARERRYVAGTRNVARLMRLFHDTIEALGTAQNSERDAFTVVDETIGWARLLRVQGEVRELADLAGEDPLQGAADRYLTLRKFAPELIKALEFKAARPHDPTLSAIRLLRDLNRSGKHAVPADARCLSELTPPAIELVAMQPVAQRDRARLRTRRLALRDNRGLLRRTPTAPSRCPSPDFHATEAVPINWQITWHTIPLPRSNEAGSPHRPRPAQGGGQPPLTLDVTFGEEASWLRKDNAGLNMAIIRKTAFNALKREPAKGSLKLKPELNSARPQLAEIAAIIQLAWRL